MTNESVGDQSLDPEIYAMHLLSKAMEPLEHAARQRVLDYARKRFLDGEHTRLAIGALTCSRGGPVRPVSLDDLGLLTNPLESLKSFMRMEGLTDLADFRFVPEPMVLKMHGVGDKSLKDFKAALAQVGVVLGGDFPRGGSVNDWKMHMQHTKTIEAEREARKHPEKEDR